MPIHTTRALTDGGGRPIGMGPVLPYGFVMPFAASVGLGMALRMPQSARLEASSQPVTGEHPATRPEYRLQDPRSLDAGRILDFGAPAPRQVVEYAPYGWRPTEAPAWVQRQRALGGRYVLAY